ncbi:MAG: SPASM domain-containing protein [Deltaproteobacteria bacterium]|nr:SPASM domain-containing protein [Deltaproteobacteria bacterium]MBW2075830.1 SPASM domain-containing protein [Deltaproteobacteria bacterium]
MKAELLQRLIREVIDWQLINPVNVAVDGEPLLYQDFNEVVQSLSAGGLNVNVATNGSLLGDRHRRLPIDFYISISVHEEDFVYRRNSIPFDRYYGRLIDFVRYRKKHRVPGNVILQISEMKEFLENRKTLKREIVDHESMAVKIHKLLKDIDIGGWNVSRIRETIQSTNLFKVFETGAFRLSVRAHKIVATNWRLCYRSYEEMPLVKYGYCDAPWTLLTVLWDGTVTHCCTDLSGRTVIGNAKAASLREIWFGKKARAVREAFDHWKVPHGICQRCLHRISENAKIMVP